MHVGQVAYVLTLVAFAVLLIISSWKMYIKAGRKGWEAIVPIYNMYVMTQIIGRPGWVILLAFFPILSLIYAVIIGIDLAKVFGKSKMFGIFGLILFPFVGYPMLAFGNDTYKGPLNPTGGAKLAVNKVPVQSPQTS